MKFKTRKRRRLKGIKRFLSAFVLAFFVFSFPSLAASEESVLVPFKESAPYQQYLRRPKGELSKLAYLMDRLSTPDLKVLSDGDEFAADYFMKDAKRYLPYSRHENAVNFIKNYFYRSDSGTILYLKYPDGHLRSLRDVLLEELMDLEKSDSS